MFKSTHPTLVSVCTHHSLSNLSCDDQANLIAAAVETVSGYLGRLTTGNSAYIRDVDTGVRLGPGEVGEICVKTMICMKVSVKEN